MSKSHLTITYTYTILDRSDIPFVSKRYRHVMTEVIEDGGGRDDLVKSERVQVLAQGIYEEFQSMIGLYGPQSITNLMPLVVSVLENLDSSLADNKDHLTALSEVNDENSQLSAQYEKERTKRREAEEKALQVEAALDNDNKALREQTKKLELDNRDLLAKNRTQLQQIETYEERTTELKHEKKELHDRNIELIKSIELLKAARASDHKRSHVGSSSPALLHRSPGYQNFAPSMEAKKRRQLPGTPKQKRAATFDGGGAIVEGDDNSQTNSSPDLLSPPPLRAGKPSSVYQEELHSNQKQDHSHGDSQVLLDGFHGTPVIPSEVHALSIEEPVEGSLSYGEHSLQGDIPGGLQMEQPDIEEEQDVLDSTLESHSDHDNHDHDDHEMSLFDELKDVGGMEEIITENEQLNIAKTDLVKQVDDVTNQLRQANTSLESFKAQLEEVTRERDGLHTQLQGAEGEARKHKQLFLELQEKAHGEVSEGAEGTRITSLEVTRLLRERNEFKEKYLSLLEQIRMNDELFMFKKKEKEKKSRWLDYFTAVFSSTKRKQLEDMYAETASPRKILLNGREGADEEDGSCPLPGAVGYSKTRTIPTFRRLTRKQEEAYSTSASWVIPVHEHTHDNGSHVPPPQPFLPNINTCRPVSSLEDGGDILCAAAVNPAVYLEDCTSAMKVKKDFPAANTFREGDGTSTSLIWVVTGVPSLTKVSIIDAATVGEVIETFTVCATPICCISVVPGFDPKDPEATTGLTTRNKQSSKKQRSSNDGASSRMATVWLGALDTGELYVHSAVSNWKRCMHADKLQSGIQAITHLEGKAFALLKDATLAVFRRFTDGEWDWDNYSIVVLCQKKDAPVTCLTATKFSLWCAVGNTVYVINSRVLKMEATIIVHPQKKAEVNQMVAIGEGVWISFKFSSTIKLFHSTAYNNMQDIDIGPQIHKVLSFGSEKRSAQMPIQVSTLLATYNCLWVGTDNGVVVTFPFATPIVIAEETGWEVLKSAEIPGSSLMEPFDVRTEHATEATPDEAKPLPSRRLSKPITPSPSPSPSHRSTGVPAEVVPFPHKGKIFSPFCNVDHMHMSIHNHVNSVKSLLCVPSLVHVDLTFEPHQGILIGPSGPNQMKAALFIVSFGEGHLDLRTADKILQALHTKDPLHSGLPSPTSIISEKNYIMVWDIVP